MEWMLMPLRRYADFEGRSRRKEYWMFYLLNLIVILGLVLIFGAFILAIDAAGGNDNDASVLLMIGIGIYVLYALAVFIPSIAVSVRRFHDQDKSGWMYLLTLIPYVGPVVLIVFMCIEGTKGPNRFGPDSIKERDMSETFS
jgi:uncharacterized membrane protein YhaH (DUF805 family)